MVKPAKKHHNKTHLSRVHEHHSENYLQSNSRVTSPNGTPSETKHKKHHKSHSNGSTPHNTISLHDNFDSPTGVNKTFSNEDGTKIEGTNSTDGDLLIAITAKKNTYKNTAPKAIVTEQEYKMKHSASDTLPTTSIHPSKSVSNSGTNTPELLSPTMLQHPQNTPHTPHTPHTPYTPGSADTPFSRHNSVDEAADILAHLTDYTIFFDDSQLKNTTPLLSAKPIDLVPIASVCVDQLYILYEPTHNK